MDDQITLTAYADQVRELIHNDRNDEAVAICRHILRYYPKYVDAYRQLGEALLEKGQHDDAKEVFRRVLGVDPESVVAYAGLAVILEQEHLVAEAAWHMERAYELVPSNTELRKELHRLYHALDGRPRARLDLTPGALARLYIQEGLFTQAIQELNAIVAESAARFDARVALAETLWRVGQVRQAADVAQALLESLPNCLKANLILGVVWKEVGLSESEQYLQRAQTLDPTNQTAQRLFGARSPLPTVQASVPRYVEGVPATPAPVAAVSTPVEPASPARPMEMPAESTFEPARESTLFGTPVFKPPVIDTTLPPWLRTPPPEIAEEPTALAQSAEPAAETPAETAPSSKQTEEPQPEPTAGTSREQPSWLEQLRQSAKAPEETTAEAPTEKAEEAESALPSWMRAETKTEEAAPTLPSWIEEAKFAETTEPPLETTEKMKSEVAPTVPTWGTEETRTEEAAPTLPSWIEEAKFAETTEPPLATPKEMKSEGAPTVPAWVTEETRAEEAVPAQPETQPSEEELPPWLRQAVPPAPAVVPVAEQPVIPAEPAPIIPAAAPIIPAAAPKRKRPTRGDSHLVLARAYRDANQMKEALAEYDYIVQKAPRLVNQVIDDLEVLSKRLDLPIEVHRILGDAYTRADRLAEALEEYRFVLKHVS